MLGTAFECSLDSFIDSLSKESNRVSCGQVIGLIWWSYCHYWYIFFSRFKIHFICLLVNILIITSVSTYGEVTRRNQF